MPCAYSRLISSNSSTFVLPSIGLSVSAAADQSSQLLCEGGAHQMRTTGPNQTSEINRGPAYGAEATKAS